MLRDDSFWNSLRFACVGTTRSGTPCQSHASGRLVLQHPRPITHVSGRPVLPITRVGTTRYANHFAFGRHEDFNGDMYLPIMLNSIVHVLVYLHYVLAALGRQSWWSRYLTSLQLTQFLVSERFMPGLVWSTALPVCWNNGNTVLNGIVLCVFCIGLRFILHGVRTTSRDFQGCVSFAIHKIIYGAIYNVLL